VQRIPFCPNPLCQNHLRPTEEAWYRSDGFHPTKAYGPVPRFQCKACRKTFSTQTFALDYYVKHPLDYRDLAARHAGSAGLRAIGRALGASCATIQNRLDRLSRQALALHAELRPLARLREDLCVDGFVSFDVSQFFPNEITIAITSHSRFVYDLSHATRRRSGSMTEAQKAKAARLYAGFTFERGAVSRTFRDILGSLATERPPRTRRPLVLITDEKKEYARELRRSALYQDQDGDHRIAQLTVHSRAPRTFLNPLFASNYLDREIRKDQANHHREASCFTRNVGNGMSRLALYCLDHNYRKKYRIKGPEADRRVHAEVAGIDRNLIEARLRAMFRDRTFLTRISLPPTLERIWRKAYVTPGRLAEPALAAFVLG